MTPPFETLTYAVEDGLATLTLNRPEQLNTFNARMRDELIAAFDLTDADDAVRAVIVTGAGRAFCAGADLSAAGDTFDYARQGDARREASRHGDVYRDGGGQVTLRMFRSLKPVIGAINGAAVGIGATMQLPMDVRLASTQARFGFVFARRGITPEAASSWFLPRLVGMQTALEWCMSGRVFGAQEALERGLVRSVHEPADLLPELQGRLPIRVELATLTEEDFVRILSVTRASLTEQYRALLATENVTIDFTDDGIAALARIAAEVGYDALAHFNRQFRARRGMTPRAYRAAFRA